MVRLDGEGEHLRSWIFQLRDTIQQFMYGVDAVNLAQPLGSHGRQDRLEVTPYSKIRSRVVSRGSVPLVLHRPILTSHRAVRLNPNLTSAGAPVARARQDTRTSSVCARIAAR